jgi:DNA-binding NarL/FixJ family response regulator
MYGGGMAVRMFGRDEELAAITDFLEEAPASPAALLIEGEPGIGKTTLWQAGMEAAAARSYMVLSGSPGERETDISFATAADLLESVADDVLPGLPAPQRAALEVALLRAEAVGRPVHAGAVAFGFLGALRALARNGRLLIAVDDIQWLDEASARLVEFASRRLGDEQVRLMLAARAAEDAPAPLGLDRAFGARLLLLYVGPLSLGAVQRLVQERLELTFPRPILIRLWEASGGNPFFALELARMIERRGGRVDPAKPLPVPASVRPLVEERLVMSSPGTEEGLLVAAALAHPTLAQLEAVLARDPRPILRPALQEQLVEVVDGRVRFTHPLVASAVYTRAEPDRLRALHTRLAEVVDDEEERARHLALATEDPDEEMAQIVEEGAGAAFARGSPAAAAELAAQARRLTPSVRRERGARRALAEAEYSFEAGDTAHAARLLDSLLADAPPGPERARLFSRRARLGHFAEDIGKSVELLERALGEAGDDAALRSEIEEGLAWGLLLLRRDLEAAAGHARSATRLAEERQGSAALAEGLAAQAVTELALGREWRDTIKRSLSLEEPTLHLRVLRHPSFAYGYCLSCADEHQKAREIFEALRRRAIEHGDESSLPSILNHLALTEAFIGEWDAAIHTAEEGYGLALECGQHPTQASILAKKALIAARRGDTEEARETARAALVIAGGPDVDPAKPESALERGGETAIWTLGFIELSVREPEEALRWLGPLAAALLAAGIKEPGEVRCLPDEIEALVALEQLDDAEQLLTMLERWSLHLQRASVRAAAGRCRGLLLAARGEPEAALGALGEAAADAARTVMPFERARTLLALGQAHRRVKRKREARGTLEEALAVFQGLGARLWAEKTRAELARIGGRAPSRGELTPTEQRVAELAAEGRSNREIAAAAFVTPKTVEFHLRNVYAKLGVRSRMQLGRALAGGSKPARKD